MFFSAWSASAISVQPSAPCSHPHSEAVKRCSQLCHVSHLLLVGSFYFWDIHLFTFCILGEIDVFTWPYHFPVVFLTYFTTTLRSQVELCVAASPSWPCPSWDAWTTSLPVVWRHFRSYDVTAGICWSQLVRLHTGELFIYIQTHNYTVIHIQYIPK